MIVSADAVARLDVELAAAKSATAVLQRRCPDAPIRAVVERTHRPASRVQRIRLRTALGEPVAYRRVRLACGERVLSLAENWYVPGRLTPAMNAALAGDVPFGAAIRPLDPYRRTLSRTRLKGRVVLRHRAVVLSGAGRPLAEVVESYTRDALTTR